MPTVDRGVVLHARIATRVSFNRNLTEQIGSFDCLCGDSVFPSLQVPVAASDGSFHELVGHADGVVGVLVCDRREGLGIRSATVVSLAHQGSSLQTFLSLGRNEVLDVGVIRIEDDHLGRAAGFTARLDGTGEGVVALHKAERAGCRAASGETLCGAAKHGQVCAGARSPLEKHPLGLREVEDRGHRILNGVDETRAALGVRVAGVAELNFLGFRVPVPVAAVVGRLQLGTPDVKPHGRVEGYHLAHQEVLEVLLKCGGAVFVREIASRLASFGDGVDDTGDKLLRAVLPLGSAHRAVKILAGDDVGGSLGP